MRPDTLRARLGELSAILKSTTRRDNEALARLERLLVRSRIGKSDSLNIHELSIERASWYGPENLSLERQQRLDQLVAETETDEPPQFRMFRREAPLHAPALDLATPAWGRGAAISQTIGPLESLDGRRFWFDFYSVVRLVPVHFAGDPLPALLFHVSQLKLKPRQPFKVADLLKLIRNRRYTLGRSSIWLRADLLAAGAPSGTYVGLKIARGSLVFAPSPVEADGKLTIPAGGRCTLALALLAQDPPAQAGGKAGIDAAKSELELPATVSFLLQNGKASVEELADASWKLYGQKIGFAWHRALAPSYEPALASVLIPQKPSVKAFNATRANSPFATLAGNSQISRAGWTLPVAAIDIEDPTDAAGNGGVAVLTADGLTLDWRGLRRGPVRLVAPWIALAPGLLFVIDLKASNRYAHQRFLLWKDESSKFRSELNLRYGDAFAVAYLAASTGNELLLATAAAEARLDRPVDVSGTPLPIRTLGSLLSLPYSDAEQFASLYDDNILVDSLDLAVTWPVEPGTAVSLAIRNALFTITPVNSLLMFAKLRDEEMVEKAKLQLGMGLFGLLPTLPDPYAANVSWLRRSGRNEQTSRRPSLLLVAGIDWTKAQHDENPDEVETGFAFAPLGAQEKTIAAWTEVAKEAASAMRPAGRSIDSEPDQLPPGTMAMATRAAGRASQEAVWNRYFGPFEREQFALLDVSSNADQMGVSFAWLNMRSADDANYTFYKLYQPQGNQAATQSVFPLQIRDLDLSAEGRFVRAFTLPQISWEPVSNLTPPAIAGDPPLWWNFYPNDGGPTRLFNDSVKLVPIAPIPVTEFLLEDFEARPQGFTGALYTLPFGLKAFAEFNRFNQFSGSLPGAKLGFNRPEYAASDVKGGLQLRADAPKHPAESPIFKGSTLQLDNVRWANGSPAYAGTLGSSVGVVFNNEFFYDGNTGYKDRGVPLTRIDFSGYGASIFSHWQNPNAAIAATSQAHFEVFVGRTANEVVQVRSLVYPWGIRVVRTITIFRGSSGYVFRFDTGWQAESDGVYDFSYRVYNPSYNIIPLPNPYEFHPGIVKGVFKVRNIRETNDVPNFRPTWNKANGETYVDDNGILRTVSAATPANERSPAVNLQPLYFDADVAIDYTTSGAAGGRVPSKGMLGFVQLAPRGEPLSPALFADLLNSQFGAIGGAVDCVIDIGNSKQMMRLSRVDVNASTSGAGPIFVSAARGAVVLPKDGSWSVVQHDQGSGEVSPVDPKATVPLIRRGKLTASGTTDAAAADLLRLANPIDLVRAPAPDTRNYGLLQSTGTQKALFRRPSFQHGLDQLLGATPDFADAYRILNSSGIFPNVQDALPLALGAFKTKILPEGYKLLDPADPAKAFTQILPETPIYLINEEFLKLYVEYAKKDKGGNKLADGVLNFGFDAAAADVAKKWLSKVNDIGMVVDLGPFTRLMMIKGKFNAEKGAAPAFIDPELEFGDDLKPVVDILQILLQLQGGDYADAMKSGLEIAMSNSADSWNYAFHARKEIPVVKFPPGMLYDQPTAPLKLECHLGIGVYFNEVLKLTDDPKQLVPSVGAFLEFGGRLSVMCVSLAAATVYATGSVDLRTAADIKTGPSLHMKFGFGAEIVVGLPVVGSVSLLYMVGVEIDLETSQITVAGFLLFRGRVELLGGLVSVTIMIEAKGAVERKLAPPESTDLIAQVTFGLDISIFLVINLHFSQSWQEQRQIA
jgi:hypothetical protein